MNINISLHREYKNLPHAQCFRSPNVKVYGNTFTKILFSFNMSLQKYFLIIFNL